MAGSKNPSKEHILKMLCAILKESEERVFNESFFLISILFVYLFGYLFIYYLSIYSNINLVQSSIYFVLYILISYLCEFLKHILSQFVLIVLFNI